MLKPDEILRFAAILFAVVFSTTLGIALAGQLIFYIIKFFK